MTTPFYPIRCCLFSLIICLTRACFPQPFGYPSSSSSYTYSPPPYGPYSAAASKSRMASDTHTYVDNSNNVDDNTAYYPARHCIQHFVDHSMTCAMAFERRTPPLTGSFNIMSGLRPVRCRSDNGGGRGRLKTYDSFKADDPLPNDKAMTTYHRTRRFAPTNGVPLDNSRSSPPNVMMGSNLFGLPQAFAPKLPSLPGMETCQPSLVQSLGTTFGVMDSGCTKPGSLPIDTAGLASGGVEPFRAPIGGANTVEVEERPIANIQLNSADICLHVCRTNAHLDGTRFSKACKSVTFDRSTGRCEIIGDAISPNGELNYVPNPDSIYFEKFCIPESELPVGCDDVVHRIPQHTLDSRASGTGAVVSAQSQVECIRRCVTAHKKLGRFTRLNRPDIYVAERRQLVDYLELAPCMRRAWQHDDVLGAWSAWSSCDSQSLSRSRHRNCSTCPEKLETETAPCINKNSLMKEFPAIMNELESEPRNIAPSLDAAKRFKPALSSSSSTADEPSLFGEQDYANQRKQLQQQYGAAEKSDFGVKGGVGEAVEICDPRKTCCPQPTDLNAVARGCSVGYKILKDGKNVPCLPESCT
uniref:Apple domain-containing protein n=1 Tax=Ditylenchus dipsaci TaxID=166011 RepID=A0A915CU17_9BILA